MEQDCALEPCHIPRRAGTVGLPADSSRLVRRSGSRRWDWAAAAVAAAAVAAAGATAIAGLLNLAFKGCCSRSAPVVAPGAQQGAQLGRHLAPKLDPSPIRHQPLKSLYDYQAKARLGLPVSAPRPMRSHVRLPPDAPFIASLRRVYKARWAADSAGGEQYRYRGGSDSTMGCCEGRGTRARAGSGLSTRQQRPPAALSKAALICCS